MNVSSKANINVIKCTIPRTSNYIRVFGCDILIRGITLNYRCFDAGIQTGATEKVPLSNLLFVIKVHKLHKKKKFN